MLACRPRLLATAESAYAELPLVEVLADPAVDMDDD